MIRKMSMKLFKSPLKILLTLVVAVSLFLADFSSFDSYASEEDLYVYFVDTGYTYFDGTRQLWSFSSYPTKSYEYGTFDLYSKDGSYIGKKKIYIWFDNISDDFANQTPYIFTDRPYVGIGVAEKPNDTTKAASIYNISYSFSKDLQNVNPLTFNFLPRSTGMSYSKVAAKIGTKNTLTIRSSGVNVPEGASGDFCTVSYTLSSDSWPVLGVGSYLITFISENNLVPIQGSVPAVLTNYAKSNAVYAHLTGWPNNVVAFNRSYQKGCYFFYIDRFRSGQLNDMTFTVAYYVSESVPSFTCIYSASVSSSIFAADSVSALKNADQHHNQQIANDNANSQAQINAGNKNADDIMHSYDNSSGAAANNQLSTILTGMEDAENKTFLESQKSIGSYVITDILTFSSGLMSGLSLIMSFANSFFIASGDLSVIVSVLYCMAFLAIILGLWRFFRGS